MAVSSYSVPSLHILCVLIATHPLILLTSSRVLISCRLSARAFQTASNILDTRYLFTTDSDIDINRHVRSSRPGRHTYKKTAPSVTVGLNSRIVKIQEQEEVRRDTPIEQQQPCTQCCRSPGIAKLKFCLNDERTSGEKGSPKRR